jgi:hypothetical protein
VDRRSFIAFAVAFGGSFSLPVSRCLAAVAGAEELAEHGSVLDPEHRALLDALTELILPATDTPGALAAGVPQFIEFMLARGFGAAERERFVTGLDQVDRISRRESGSPFVSLPAERQIAILQDLEEAGKALRTADDPGFFQVLKELTLIGYYTSETGATLEARYVPVPGRYEACVPLQPDDRAFADGTPLDTLL